MLNSHQRMRLFGNYKVNIFPPARFLTSPETRSSVLFVHANRFNPITEWLTDFTRQNMHRARKSTQSVAKPKRIPMASMEPSNFIERKKHCKHNNRYEPEWEGKVGAAQKRELRPNRKQTITANIEAAFYFFYSHWCFWLVFHLCVCVFFLLYVLKRTEYENKMIEVIHRRPLKSGYRGRCATKTKNCTCCVSRVNVFKFMTAWRNRVVVISKMFYVACVNGMSIYFSYFCHLNFVRFRIIFFLSKSVHFIMHIVFELRQHHRTNRMCHAIQPFYVSCAFTYKKTKLISWFFSVESLNFRKELFIWPFSFILVFWLNAMRGKNHIHCILLIILPFGMVYKRIASNYSHFADIVTHSYELIAFAFFTFGQYMTKKRRRQI